MPLTEASATQAHQLIGGAEKIFSNAEALFEEATVLAGARAWPRALFLHQISLEECAKVDSLGAAVTSLLMGHDVDVAALRKAFLRHEYKNKANAYFLEATEVERQARQRGDFHAALNEFKERQKAFHVESNSDKNASLYVDFGEEFTSPQELITEDVFVKVRQRNSEFMTIAYHHIRMMRGWAKDIYSSAELVTDSLAALGLTNLEVSDQAQLKAFLGSYDEKMQALVSKRLASMK